MKKYFLIILLPFHMNSVFGMQNQQNPMSLQAILSAPIIYQVKINPDGSHTCPFCQEQFKELGRHVIKCKLTPHEEPQWLLEIPIFCNGHIITTLHWRPHTNDHASKFLCPHCDYKTRTRNTMVQHMLDNHNNVYVPSLQTAQQSIPPIEYYLSSFKTQENELDTDLPVQEPPAKRRKIATVVAATVSMFCHDPLNCVQPIIGKLATIRHLSLACCA